MKLAIAAFVMIAASVPAAGQDEDFHRAKFPEKPENQAAGRAIVHRHLKNHWIIQRDADHLVLHIQAKVTLANVGYRMVLTVRPDGAGFIRADRCGTHRRAEYTSKLSATFIMFTLSIADWLDTLCG